MCKDCMYLFLYQGGGGVYNLAKISLFSNLLPFFSKSAVGKLPQPPPPHQCTPKKDLILYVPEVLFKLKLHTLYENEKNFLDIQYISSYAECISFTPMVLILDGNSELLGASEVSANLY